MKYSISEDQLFKEYQDKVEDRMGIRPLDRRDILEIARRKRQKNAYKSPRNDLKQKLLKTIKDDEEGRAVVEINLDTTIEEYENDIKNTILKDKDRLDNLFGIACDLNDQYREKHPNAYTDVDCLMDFFAKINDRLE